MKYVKTYLAFALGLVVSSSIQAAEVDCGPENIVEHRKPLIHFEAFPMVNAETGEEYHPNDIIDVPDENGNISKVKASDYFAKLNELEAGLNAWGYTLRQEDEDNLSSLNYCVNRLQAQMENINKYVREQEAQFLESDASWLERWNTAWDEYKKNIPSWDDLYRYADDKEYDVYMPELPVFTADRPTFTPKPIEFSKEKTYTLYEGNSKDFAVGVYPYYKIGATKVEARGEAGVDVEGAVLGKWEGNIAHIAIKTHSPGTGPLTVDLVASVIDGRKTWNKPLVKTGALRYHDEIKTSVAKSVSYRFAIGPIPCKAEAGVRGEAGFQWGIELYPLQVGAYTGPWAAVDAYAQVGADVVIAGVGAGGHLILAEYQLTLQGSGVFEYIDEPQIKLSMALTSDLTLLSGKLYGYAYIWVPKFTPPFVRKKTWKHTLFSWDGYKNSGTLFDYSAVLSRNGLVAGGDLSPEDVLEMNHINREAYVEALEEKSILALYDIMVPIADDIASQANREVPVAAARVNELTQNVDNRRDEYWAKLQAILGS